MWLVGGRVGLHNALSISTQTEWEPRALVTQYRNTPVESTDTKLCKHRFFKLRSTHWWLESATGAAAPGGTAKPLHSDCGLVHIKTFRMRCILSWWIFIKTSWIPQRNLGQNCKNQFSDRVQIAKLALQNFKLLFIIWVKITDIL